jgi:hypothetical protein
MSCADDDGLRLIPSDEGRVLLDTRNDRMLKLNSVSTEIWMLLSAGEKEPQIVEKIAQKYQVDVQRVADDVQAFLRRIRDFQLSPTDSILSSSSIQSEQNRSPREASFPWYGQAGVAAPNQISPVALVIGAFLGLVAFDLILSLTSFQFLCSCVKTWPIRRKTREASDVIAMVCSSVQRACVWYPKRSLCLQRTAVTTCLLRIYGVAALMMVGVRPIPFLAHAWVEVGDSVVNDWPGVKNFYTSLISY